MRAAQSSKSLGPGGSGLSAMSLAVPMRALMPAIIPSAALWFWSVAGALFALAFGIYLGAIGPMLVGPRVDGEPG